MNQTRILVIEDDPHIRELLRVCLEQEGYLVEMATDGLTGLERARKGCFNLVILDLMLPGVDGFTICRELAEKEGGRTPVLILTAKGEEMDRVLGLKLGADDYVVKPFSPRELAARVEAILRRVEPPAAADMDIAVADLKISPSPARLPSTTGKFCLPPRSLSCCSCWPPIPGEFSPGKICSTGSGATILRGAAELWTST